MNVIVLAQLVWISWTIILQLQLFHIVTIKNDKILNGHNDLFCPHDQSLQLCTEIHVKNKFDDN